MCFSRHFYNPLTPFSKGDFVLNLKSYILALIKPVGGTVDGRLQVLLADVGVDLGNREPFSRYCVIR